VFFVVDEFTEFSYCRRIPLTVFMKQLADITPLLCCERCRFSVIINHIN